MNKNDRVAVVVVTYNRKTTLLECISSVLKQTFKVRTIYIIDNASTDGTFEFVCEKFKLCNLELKKHKSGYCYADFFVNNILIKYIKLFDNVGSSGGFNQGMKLAYINHDYIWIMDDDVIPYQDALEYLYKSCNDYPNAAFVASNVVNSNKDMMNVPEVDMRRAIGKYSQWNKSLKYGCVKIRTATFVSLLFPKSTILKIGFPIKDFFIWGDDSEYTFRATQGDNFAYLIGKSIVLHKRNIANETLSLANESDKNRIYMYEYLYRNSIFVLRRRNEVKGFVKYFIEWIFSAFNILKNDKRYKVLKLKILIIGALKGMVFNPEIEKSVEKFYANEIKNKDI